MRRRHFALAAGGVGMLALFACSKAEQSAPPPLGTMGPAVVLPASPSPEAVGGLADKAEKAEKSDRAADRIAREVSKKIADTQERPDESRATAHAGQGRDGPTGQPALDTPAAAAEPTPVIALPMKAPAQAPPAGGEYKPAPRAKQEEGKLGQRGGDDQDTLAGMLDTRRVPERVLEKDALGENERQKRKVKTADAEDATEANAVNGANDGTLRADGWFEPPASEVRPDSFLPRVFYFENTYLGGNAAFSRRLEALERDWPDADRPYERAAGPAQPFDAPGENGIGLTVHLDRVSLDHPGRVYLQVGLQGSPRFGWRRPPLDLALVVDAPVLAEHRDAVAAIARAALRKLEATDRLAIVLSGANPVVLLDLEGPRALQTDLARALDHLGTTVPATTPGALGAAVTRAGELLHVGAGQDARIPGAQEVLVLSRGEDGDRVAPAAEAAHAIGIDGVITSVSCFQSADAAPRALAFWDIAQAGQGNLRSVASGSADGDKDAENSGAVQMLSDELSDLSRVVARLIRVNIRLGARTHAVRVIGSRMLDRVEVARVKAREEAVDRNLSKTLGVKADRGADDDGVQTVIPYFYGGDAHVIALELWVDGPGPVADVTLKYKDMVNLGNATAQASVGLMANPRPPTATELQVRRNIRSFLGAEALAEAAALLDQGQTAAAQDAVRRATALTDALVDRDVTERLAAFAGRLDPALGGEALRLAAARRVGVFPGARP